MTRTSLVLLTLLLTIGSERASAQTAQARMAHEAVLRIAGLTSAQRDALQQQLKHSDLQLVYACVPAGILVFRSTATTATELQQRSLALVNATGRSNVAAVLPIGRQEAEEQCAQARNQ